ncbi:hypothetical protein AOLI_G00080520 [Acnodon oligacanthus]
MKRRGFAIPALNSAVALRNVMTCRLSRDTVARLAGFALPDKTSGARALRYVLSVFNRTVFLMLLDFNTNSKTLRL